MAPSSDDTSALQATVTDVLSEHPVTVGILFGSRARGETHEHSDIDIAVAFEDCKPGDSGYNDTLFGLSSDLATALGTDDVDVIDIRRASPTLAEAVFERGTVLVGTEREVAALREQLGGDSGERRSPAERFDDVLAAIDDHLA